MKKPDFKYHWETWKQSYGTGIYCIRRLAPGWQWEVLAMIFVTLLFPVVFLITAYLEADDAKL